MTHAIRIGSGLGFYGDNWEPVVASIERGQVQFIASDHLAELTLAILQKDRQRDPSLGYARDVVPMLLRLLPLMQPRGVRFVCNAGGLNPMGAALAVRSPGGAHAHALMPNIAVACLSLRTRCHPAHLPSLPPYNPPRALVSSWPKVESGPRPVPPWAVCQEHPPLHLVPCT